MPVVLFGWITTGAIASIVIPCVIISGIFISRGVPATIVVHVFAVIAGSGFRAVVTVGRHFFAGVWIIKQRFRLRFLSPRFVVSGLLVRNGHVSRLRSARHSEDAEYKAEQERKKFVHSGGEPSQEAQRLSISE